ncbi:MAG: cytochrome C assembly protein [Pseudomonadales bacterium]|nr:cytochrome C assembly protein [Pseudomonadales bacterium]
MNPDEPRKEQQRAVNVAIIAGILACICYGVSTTLIIRSLKTDTQVDRRALLGIASLGLLLHAYYLYDALLQPEGVQLGVTTMAALFALVLAATSTGLAFFRRIESLLAPAYPVAITGLVIALLFSDGLRPDPHLGEGVIAHILLSISAYCVLALALSQATLLWIQNHQLKHRHLHDVLNLLPPLQTMESSLFDLISISLLLLSFAIGTGFIFVDDFFAQHLLHKTVFALGAWAVLVLLLAGRTLWGWRGMVAVRWTLTGFVLLTLGYFGSKVVLEVILQRV